VAQKKTNLTASNSHPLPTDLAERYEALRREVLRPGRRWVEGEGLGVLISRGITAWMRAISDRLPRGTSGPASRPVVPSIELPKWLAREAVAVMTAMVLAVASKEVTA
jgi:hypothetical protein